MFRIHESNNTAHSLTAEFSPNTEITIDTSYLNNQKYGDYREDIGHTGVSIESETGNARFVILKGFHFSLQGSQKKLIEVLQELNLMEGIWIRRLILLLIVISVRNIIMMIIEYLRLSIY